MDGKNCAVQPLPIEAYKDVASVCSVLTGESSNACREARIIRAKIS
jgi:hypothetical protein